MDTDNFLIYSCFFPKTITDSSISAPPPLPSTPTADTTFIIG